MKTLLLTLLIATCPLIASAQTPPEENPFFQPSTLPYQLPPFNTADNADILVVMTVGLLTLLLALVPFIPILRDIPRWIPLHRLIWRKQGPPPQA